MKPLDLRTVARVLKTALPEQLGGTVEGVSTDSRTVRPGQLFFAIRGDRFDGHNFLPRAIGKGACAAVVDRAGSRRVPGWCRNRLLEVRDTRKALLDLAEAYRNSLDLAVVAVTGSCGKTTTKDLIHHFLSSEMRGVRSPRSFNNDVGVPLTLFEVEEHHDFAVVEIGANAPGEIAELGAVVSPRVGVITNIRPVHLEGFGSLWGVARAKGELVWTLPEDGVFVFNPVERGCAALARRYGGGAVTFGNRPGCTYRLENVENGSTCLRVVIRGVEFKVPLLGRHNAMNVLAAVSVGSLFGLSLEGMARAVRSFEGPMARMKPTRLAGVTMIDDAYNSNPASAVSAIRTFQEMKLGGRKVLVLGDMMELGTRSLDFHRLLGRAAAELDPDLTVAVGPLSGATTDTMQARGIPPSRILHFEETENAARELAGLLKAGDTVLLKASRRMGFEKIKEAIERMWAASRRMAQPLMRSG